MYMHGHIFDASGRISTIIYTQRLSIIETTKKDSNGRVMVVKDRTISESEQKRENKESRKA